MIDPGLVPVPVSITGVPLGNLFTLTGVWSIFALCLLWLIKQRPQMASARNTADASLRGDLLRRVRDLETDANAARAEAVTARHECDKQLDAMRAEMNAREKHCEEEMAKLRDEIAGLRVQFQQAQISAVRAAGGIPPDWEKLIDKLGEKKGSGK